ncbi:MAG: prohibitin family protein [Lachnospiraceae bacterium]|nr:prohibitin family protein [Lachnospiraceae bacterium]
MFKFITSILIFIICIFVLFLGIKRRQKNDNKINIFFIVGGVGCFLSVVMIASSCFYTQDIGEVIVKKNWDGALHGQTEDPGFHTKSPLETCIVYNTRNMLINFYGTTDDSPYAYDGGSAQGPQVTINDKSGASADIDIQVVYSLDPSAAMDLYANYGTQTNYTQSYLANDVRSVARKVSGKFDTITMLTDRAQYQNAVQEALKQKWSENGLNVEQVSVQEVRYPEAITQKYAEAQSAEIAKAQALNEQETAKVQAETKKINAQAEADANRILDESLTDKVLQQQYINALTDIGRNGNLVVVPEGSQPIVAGKAAQ